MVFTMKHVRALAILNSTTLLLHIGFAYATQSKFVSERTVGDVSDQHPSFFTPAAVTFAIWGVIYAALAGFCVYHLWLAFRRDKEHAGNKDISRVGPLFAINNLATIGWLFAWTNEQFLLSVLLIAFQLVMLIAINLRLGIHDEQRNLASKAFTQFPLSLYFAWLTIATIANISVYFTTTNINFGLTPSIWTMIVIGLTVLIAMLVVLKRRNVFYGLVIIWAMYGIILKGEQTDPTIYREVMQAAWLGTCIVSLTCIYQFIRNILIQNEFRNELYFPESSKTPEA
jgi:hypothetical protein